LRFEAGEIQLGAVLKSLFWWMLLGLELGAVGGAIYFGYLIVQDGIKLSSIPFNTLLTEVGPLVLVRALWGLGIGFAFGLLTHLFSGLKSLLSRLLRRSSPTEEIESPDGVLRAVRERQADEYLAGRESTTLDSVGFGEEGDEGAPDIENIITAREGLYTYRILAYRHLSDHERVSVVKEALKNGNLKEPEPGGTATVMTNIGRLRD
jgi:hypothetical protein